MTLLTDKKFLKRIKASETLKEIQDKLNTTSTPVKEEAVILSRVSCLDQEKGSSLEAQQQILQEYCSEHKFSIIKAFGYTESSTRGPRKKYKEFIDFLEKYNGVLNVVVPCVDRLHRLSSDMEKLNKFRAEGKINIHFIKENKILTKTASGSDIAWWESSVTMAHSYILQLIDNVTRSQKYIWDQEQRWQGKAPLGYKNIHWTRRDIPERIKNKGYNLSKKYFADVVPDPDTAKKIQKLFMECSKGKKSIQILTQYAKQIGLTSTTGKQLSTSSIHYILTNPFYCGIMVIKGKAYPHCHEKLITQELFEKVAAVLEDRAKIEYKKPYQTEAFALRGIIKCACGSGLSPYKKKGHIYLKCSQPGPKCSVKNIKEEPLLNQIKKDIFDKISIPADTIQSFKSLAKDYIEQDSLIKTSDTKTLLAEKNKLGTRQQRLVDLYLDNEITKEIFDNKYDLLTKQIKEIDSKLTQHTKDTTQITNKVNQILDGLKDINLTFESSQPEKKNSILKIVVENCVYDGQKLQISLKKPFDKIVKNHDHPIWLCLLDELRTFSETDFIQCKIIFQTMKDKI